MNLDVAAPCAEQSLAVGEPLRATALEKIDLWLLLEVDGRWPARTEEAQFPLGVREWLAEIRRLKPATRLLFIRQPQREGSVRVMSLLTEGERQLRAFEFDSLDCVASLPVEALVGPSEMDGCVGACEAPSELFLVCAHGRRDRCCAKRGVALYNALEEHLPRDEVWQCSHLGGHRFAATVVHLPSATHYGRVRVEQASQLVQASLAGEIFHLANYRGCCDLARPAQAAEAVIRELSAERRFGAVQFLSMVESGDAWDCRLMLGEQHHLVRVARRQLDVSRAASCGAETLSPVVVYEVLRHGCSTDGTSELVASF